MKYKEIIAYLEKHPELLEVEDSGLLAYYIANPEIMSIGHFPIPMNTDKFLAKNVWAQIGMVYTFNGNFVVVEMSVDKKEIWFEWVPNGK